MGQTLAADGTPLWDGYTTAQDKQLRADWGLKLQDWEAIRAAGDPAGGCAGCGRLGVTLVIDDDHDTGEIRGLLCHTCNRKLSERLCRYILDPPARRVGPYVIPDALRISKARRRAARNLRRRQARAANATTKTTSPPPAGGAAAGGIAGRIADLA